MQIESKYDMGDTVMYEAMPFKVIEVLVHVSGISYGCRREDGAFLMFREEELRRSDDVEKE